MLKKSLALMLSSSLFIACAAMAETTSSQRTINVQGTGSVQVIPNMATIQVAVETSALQAKAAVQANADKMNAVMGVLKKQLTAEDKISTSRFNLVPQYEYNKDTQRSVLTGYQVVNYVSVNTKQLDKLGDLLDTLTQAGANRIENLQFTHDDWHAYEKEALAQAVVDAQDTATILAKAANVNLGELLEIQPPSSGVAPMREMSLAKTSLASGTPLEPGEMTVSMSVAASYAIQ